MGHGYRESGTLSTVNVLAKEQRMNGFWVTLLGAMAGGVAAGILLAIGEKIKPYIVTYIHKTPRQIRRKYRHHLLNRKKYYLEYATIIAENIDEYASPPSEWSDLQKRCWNEAIYELYRAGALWIDIEISRVHIILSKNHEIDEEKFPEMVFQLNLFTYDNPAQYQAMWQDVSDLGYTIMLRLMIAEESLHAIMNKGMKGALPRFLKRVGAFLISFLPARR